MEAALNCTEFFRNESCGKCVPCRMGSQKIVEILSGILHGQRSQNVPTTPSLLPLSNITQSSMAKLHLEHSGNGHSHADDLGTVNDLSNMLLEAAICGLGWVVSSPIRSMIKHFPHIVEKYVKIQQEQTTPSSH